MKCSELTLIKAISMVDNFLPVKILYNGEVLYNDYDSEVEIDEELYGEEYPPMKIIPFRIRGRENNIITSIDIEIVDHHHSIIRLQGENYNVRQSNLN
jgi:hypothetical protein